MILGFTGSRRGMTGRQKLTVGTILEDTQNLLLARHGDCVGADAEFNYLCDVRHIDVEIHPCTIEDQRAYCSTACITHVYDAKPPLERNRDIVRMSTMVVAAPAEDTEQLRSGTWSTIRRCREMGKVCLIVLPDGSICAEVPGE